MGPEEEKKEKGSVKISAQLPGSLKMKRARTVYGDSVTLVALVLFAALFFVQSAFACPCSEIKVPEKPEAYEIETGLAFMKTPEYKKEFRDAVANARKACQRHLGEKNLAVVSDIDETVLSNIGYFETHRNAGWKDWEQWLEQSDATLLKPTADFLAWARKKGYAIFFITGRHEKDRANTIKNLIKRGLAYDGLYMRPDGDESRAAEFKSKYRKQIEDMGFKVIVNIGDQISDLAGGYSEDCEKLPNKLYFVK